jgi:hypothetical protein
MKPRVCDVCGKKVPVKDARICGSCKATFCSKDFSEHERKYGSRIGQGCMHPRESRGGES